MYPLQQLVSGSMQTKPAYQICQTGLRSSKWNRLGLENHTVYIKLVRTGLIHKQTQATPELEISTIEPHNIYMLCRFYLYSKSHMSSIVHI